MGDQHLICFVCGERGRDPSLGGRCACGARNWVDPSPRPDDVDLSLVCFVCGQRGRVRALGGRCECGARNWVSTTPKSSPPSPPSLPPSEQPFESALRPLGSDSARRLIVDAYPGSAIATALRGIARGMVVMLVGAAGVGKSTLAAQAGFTIAKQIGGRLYWLDADQLKEELIEEAFVRARCPPEQLGGRIFPVHEENEKGSPDFRRACAHVPEGEVMVVDSLEAWAPRGDKQALECLRVLRAHPARVKLVIAASNASGGVAGDGELERACDATVFVEREKLRVGKCRWTIGATWTRCGPGGLVVEQFEEPESAELIEQAPKEQVISERERTALVKILHHWPSAWSFMTAREIIEAIERDEAKALGDALRELAGVEALAPSNVGHALRWVKDLPIHGRVLASKLDRKAKIARWNVVRVV